MAGISRSLLASMNLTEEQQKTIIDANADTLREIKEERDRLKADADKLPALQRQLDDLRADVKANYVPKADAEKTRKEFDDYKAGIEKEKTDAAKTAAARSYFESRGIKDNSLDIAMMASKDAVSALELAEDGKAIKDAKTLDELISGKFAGLVTKETATPFTAPTPPAQAPGAAQQQPSRAAQLYQAHYAALYGGAQKGSENT